jgi:hypothetical protein
VVQPAERLVGAEGGGDRQFHDRLSPGLILWLDPLA